MHPLRPNSHRLRHGRSSEPGRGYLVTTVVHQRTPIFKNLRLGRLLVAEMRLAHEQFQINSLAWVVMPDHLHWLVQLEQAGLSEVMRGVKSRSTLAINRAMGRNGAFWQNGFHDRAIRDNQDLRPCARYIIANPLRAGLVDRIGDYPLWDTIWL
ncbi:REP-associated tyrosine transposase [Pseudomonas brassicacearum]|uniref:Transposase n=1 Tax=Pseudomonas brassicacearum subsp. neoaurantiaca TaxID=494916 RepID=A0A7V8RIR7_9PSED|nr:transposase [Pseudomonas brassicacearum]MBA1376605.1 transposase [Pseudomonas brassicacearum subsp. neoaurantiaca]